MKMKELKFSTEKGNFILIEDEAKLKHFIPWDLCELVGSVKNMTEEQFAEVVDSSIHTGLFAHYVKDIPVNTYCYKSGAQSLESLVKSLGWYLWENPIKLPYSLSYCSSRMTYYGYEVRQYHQAESKTFYNPILLKKI